MKEKKKLKKKKEKLATGENNSENKDLKINREGEIFKGQDTQTDIA